MLRPVALRVSACSGHKQSRGPVAADESSASLTRAVLGALRPGQQAAPQSPAGGARIIIPRPLLAREGTASGIPLLSPRLATSRRQCLSVLCLVCAALLRVRLWQLDTRGPARRWRKPSTSILRRKPPAWSPGEAARRNGHRSWQSWVHVRLQNCLLRWRLNAACVPISSACARRGARSLMPMSFQLAAVVR